ncbi:MAG: hypothetical protein R6W83_07510 [Cryobacterium sp.]
MSDNTPTDGTSKPDRDAASHAERSTPEYAAPTGQPAEQSTEQPTEPSLTKPPYVAPDGTRSAGSARDDAAAHDAAVAAAAARANSAPFAGDYTDSESVETAAAAPAAPAAAPAHAAAAPAVATEPMVATVPAPVGTDPAPQYTDPAPEYTAPVQQTPIYVQAPTPPRDRGNRGAGVLIALLATLVYTAIYALVALVIAGMTSSTLATATATFAEFAVRPVFYVPVIFFFLAFSLLIVLVNRAGWWSYVLFGFLVAVVVYFSYLSGALLTVQAWNQTPEAALRFLSSQWLNPGAIAAAVIAREVPIWFGAWISRRGRGVTARNAAAHAEYERILAEGPQLSRSH